MAAGARYGTLNNCTLSGNSAVLGGGAYISALNNCALWGNVAVDSGGGSHGGPLSSGALNNCTLVGNSASNSGGGAYSCTLNNCIVFYNAAPDGANWYGGTWRYCCTTPMPGGTGNITSEPMMAATNNLRLAPGSPCIDAGNSAYAPDTIDLDGNQRIVGSSVDIGAFEYQPYWAWTAGITNGLTNYWECAADDGYPNLLKYSAGGDPTIADSSAALGCAQADDGSPLLMFNRSTNAVDVTIIVEGSSFAINDSPWAGIATNSNGSWGGATNVVEMGTSTPVRVLVSDMAMDPTNRFLRLRITRP
jgi:hypothetical protein